MFDILIIMNYNLTWKEFSATPDLMKWLFLCAAFHYNTRIKDLRIYFSTYYSRNITKCNFIVIRVYLTIGCLKILSLG